MTTVVWATYENNKLLLSEPLSLPEKTRLRVTVETKEIMELLTPLIPELNQNICSPSAFYERHVDLLEKVRTSGRPLVLWKATGPVALVLALETYLTLEKRRQNVIEVLTRIGENPVPEKFWPPVGRRRINSLKRVMDQIERKKTQLTTSKNAWNRSLRRYSLLKRNLKTWRSRRQHSRAI